MKLEPIVCFIDDSPFERSLFEEVFPAAAPGWRFIITASFSGARQALGHQSPILWLLDLWGNDPEGALEARMPSPEELSAAAAAIPGLAGVWDGLESYPGDKINELLKRLYSLLSGWRALFMAAARQADQTRAYGLYNLAQVRKRYPGAAAVAYTRKSSAEDVCAFLRAGGDGALLKPHGPTDEAIRAETRDKAPALVEDMKRIVDRRATEALLKWSQEVEDSPAAHLRGLAKALRGLAQPPEAASLDLDPGRADFIEAVRVWLAARAGD